MDQLQQLSCFDCDAGGTLYGVCQHGSNAPAIITVDARHTILARSSSSNTSSNSQAGGQVSVSLDLLHVSTVVKTATAIDFVVKSISASRNGHYLLLVGHQGEDYAAIAVVDVYGGRIVSGGQAGAPSTPGVGGGVTPLRAKRGVGMPSAPAGSSGVRHKECSVHPVDPQLFQSHPGLVVYQASWHPHSDNHLAVLTSDSCWRLYSLEDLSLPEQTFDLRACLSEPVGSAGPGTSGRQPPGTPARSPGPARFGLLQEVEHALGVTAFAFGPAVSWGYFTVHFLVGSGAVYALCPVCPFGVRVPASVVKHAIQTSNGNDGLGQTSGADPVAADWLKSVFGATLFSKGVDSKQRWTAQRHIHEAAAPCLQGPLNEGAASSTAASTVAPAVALHASHLALGSMVDSDAALAPLRCTSCVVTGLSDGRLFAHACHGLLGPCWADQPAQCVVDVRGDVRAARYQCSIVPLPPPPPSSPVGADCGALLLLDMLDLQLPAAPSRLPSSPALGVDSEDDDALNPDGPDGVLGLNSGLRRLRLLGSHENPRAFWACHESGCWAIAVPWLPTLSQALAAGQDRGDGRAPTFDPAELTLGLGRLQLAVETVPPPTVRELVQLPASGEGGPWLAAAAVLPDLFLGDSLLALKMPGLTGPAQTPGPGRAPAPSLNTPAGPTFACFPLRAAAGAEIEHANSEGAQPTEVGQEADAEAGAGSRAGAGTGAGAATVGDAAASRAAPATAASSLSAARRELLDANIRAIYIDLVKGWSPLKLPATEGPTGSQDPEGALYLAQCIALMRQHHIEFIHRTDADLRQRTQQLDQEAEKHRTALAELQQLLATAQQRQAALSERSHRMLELQQNLVERSEILAQLHWSLPRALSDQEVQLASELGGFEANSQSLASSWTALRRRVDAALADGRSKPHMWAAAQAAAGGAGRAASLPPAQAAKVHAAIMEQFKLISAAMHEVKQMEADMDAWKLGQGSE